MKIIFIVRKFQPIWELSITIKQTTIVPLLFRMFDDFEDKNIDEETLCKVLKYLLTYLVRITACEINKNLSKFMKSMYDRVIDGNYDNYYEKFVIFLNDSKTNVRPSDIVSAKKKVLFFAFSGSTVAVKVSLFPTFKVRLVLFNFTLSTAPETFFLKTYFPPLAMAIVTFPFSSMVQVRS